MKHANLVRKILLILAASACSCGDMKQRDRSDAFENFTVNPQNVNVEFFWRDDKGEILRSIGNLKNYVERNGRHLRFAMNGGMYQTDNKPLGLFIENQKTVASLNTRDAKGNFYIKPNGVFYITVDGRAFIVPTQNFIDDNQIKYATQSGPMLLVDGTINPEFARDSGNLNIRNGVCVYDGGEIVFAISRREVNFYDFAEYFKNSGCRNALYLDGFVSRMYLPEKDFADAGGDFGVIIGVAE